MSEPKRYARDQSRLYKVTSPSKLASNLHMRIGELRALEAAKDNYIRWDDRVTGRPIQQPKPKLDQLHRKVAVFLARLQPPEFLHSAVKGRSYISNAAEHAAGVRAVKVDLKKFYPSTRAQAVYHFFRDRMLCADDVAGLLAKLLTVDGHLATGSSVSPILSYFAYEDMFHELDDLARSRGCKFSVYVDDMVFTGPEATRRLVYDVIQIVRRYRLHAHKIKMFKPGQPRVITGVTVTRAGSRLPNKRQKKIAEELDRLMSACSDSERLAVIRPLVGRLYEAGMVDARWLAKAKAMNDTRRGVQRRVDAAATAEFLKKLRPARPE